MNIADFDASTSLELTQDGDEFIVWLFDWEIGRGSTIEEAIGDARSNVRDWVG